MSTPNQVQSQKQVESQSITQTNNADNQQIHPNHPFVNDPTFWIIIALSLLFRVILGDRPSSSKK